MKKIITFCILCAILVAALVPVSASAPAGAYFDGVGIRYRSSSGSDVVGRIYAVGADRSGGLLAPGYWRFDEDGYAVPDDGIRVDPDGAVRYYDHGEAQYAGLVADKDGYLYYINSAKKAVLGRSYAISEARANGLLPAGVYSFAEDGRLYVEVPVNPWDSIQTGRWYLQVGG